MSRWLLIIFLLFLGTGCGLFEKNPPPLSPPATSQRFLGTLSMVNEAGNFVLVDFGGFASPEPGAELLVRRDGREVAKLQAGTQIRRPFAAADILSGNPQAGDDVWSIAPAKDENSFPPEISAELESL